jgi:hypothetical protein
MEDALEAYKLPYGKKRPAACLDEANWQLIEGTRAPRPAQPGQAALYDYEYAHNGAANLFMMFESLAQWREVTVTERRAMRGFPHCLRDLVEIQYPDAEKIVLTMDNLNTHPLPSLHAAFEPPEARRLSERFEIHYTPKHGSWLNMAELGISAMSRQCLRCRIPAIGKMAAEVQSWAAQRNKGKKTARWQFATEDARIKLRHLYPRI